MMNGSYMLFAQISHWQRLGDGIHSRRWRMELDGFLLTGIVLVVIATAIAAAVFIKKRNDFSQPCDDPQRLFRELSLAHNLDRASQKLLRQLADAFQIAQPAEVFLQPALFEPSKLPEQLREEEERLLELKSRIF